MYLLDTNIFLEILLRREKSEAAKHLFIANASTDLFMTDFSLHSLGVFLFQRNRQEAYVRFVKDVIIQAGIAAIGIRLTRASRSARILQKVPFGF